MFNFSSLVWSRMKTSLHFCLSFLAKTWGHPPFFRWRFRLQSSQTTPGLDPDHRHWNLSNQASVQQQHVNWEDSFVVSHSASALWFFSLWGLSQLQIHSVTRIFISKTSFRTLLHLSQWVTPTASARGEIWLQNHLFHRTCGWNSKSFPAISVFFLSVQRDKSQV